MLRGSRAFSGKIHLPFLAQVVLPFTTRVSGGDTWRCKLGTTKDQGLYNKPSAAVRPGALAVGTIQQYNTRQYIRTFCQNFVSTNIAFPCIFVKKIITLLIVGLLKIGQVSSRLILCIGGL